MSHRPGIRNFPRPSMTSAVFGSPPRRYSSMAAIVFPLIVTILCGRAGLPVASMTVISAKTSGRSCAGAKRPATRGASNSDSTVRRSFIGDSLFLAGLFVGACAAQPALHRVVVLVTCVLEETCARRREGNLHRPGRRPGVGIVDRRAIRDHARSGPRQPLDAVCEGRRHEI